VGWRALATTGRTDQSGSPRFLPSLAAFLGDFARYAGRGGALAACLVAAGALFESLSLVLLIPILAVVVGSGGALARFAGPLFQAAGARTPFTRLLLLLAIFAVLMLVRAVVVTWRDVRLAALQIGFLESLRGGVADQLAAARWDRLVRLRHARIAHLMSGDIQRVSTGASFLVQSAVSLVMLATQCVVAFWLAPDLALVALGLLLIVGLALGPMVARSQRLGRFVTGANLSLLDTSAQFLGGLKLAVS
jgi:ATP-binding cassette, subfamily C, bacterial